MLIAIHANRGNAAPAAMADEALFRSVEAALRFAYRTEGVSIVKVSSYLPSLRGSTVRGKRRSDGPWDDHAQAAMILAMAERTLTPPQMICVRGYYTVPSGQMLETRKSTDCLLVSELIASDQKIPRWLIIDVVREMFGYSRRRSDKWWASHLGRGEKTIRLYILGDRGRGMVGIVPFINSMMGEATSALHMSMVQEGVVDG